MTSHTFEITAPSASHEEIQESLREMAEKRVKDFKLRSQLADAFASVEKDHLIVQEIWCNKEEYKKIFRPLSDSVFAPSAYVDCIKEGIFGYIWNTPVKVREEFLPGIHLLTEPADKI